MLISFKKSPNIHIALVNELNGLPDYEYNIIIDIACGCCDTDFVAVCHLPRTGGSRHSGKFYTSSDEGCLRFFIAALLYTKYNKNLRETGIIMCSVNGRRKESTITEYLNRFNYLFSPDDNLGNRVNAYRPLYNKIIKNIYDYRKP